MKELTIEEKAKRYDELIVTAQELEHDGCFDKITLFDLFPELEESEDEKIRKTLIEGFKDYGQPEAEWWNGVKIKDCIAWLEKQSEHANFRNKIQIGDKVTRNRDGMLVNLSQLNRVAKKDENQEYQKPAEISNICEFSIKTWIKIVDYVLTEHNGIGNYLIDPEVKDTAEKLQKKYKFDAASEEWDRVYRKGLDAGVNKGRAEALREQKPAEWSEEDEKKLDAVCYHLTDHCDTVGEYRSSELADWLKSLKDRVQPKQEWSEEDDERMFDFAIRAIGLCKQYAINHQASGYSKLPDVPERYEELQNWLKSLKGRFTWKPSEEQIKAVRLARSFVTDDFDENPTLSDVLVELEKQLKKLREG